jgi:hypothetical protein
MSALLRKEWLKSACLKQPGIPIDNAITPLLFQAQLLRADWSRFTCTISDGFHMIEAELDPEAVKQFEKDQQRTRPALNGSIITCMKVAIMYCTSTSRRDIIFTLGRVRCSFRSRKICDALGKF